MSIFGKTLEDIGCKCMEINGKEPDFEDKNYKFCPWCVDQFEEMASVDECCDCED